MTPDNRGWAPIIRFVAWAVLVFGGAGVLYVYGQLDQDVVFGDDEGVTHFVFLTQALVPVVVGWGLLLGIAEILDAINPRPKPTAPPVYDDQGLTLPPSP